MTMSMTLVTSVEPFVQIFATSVNCHNGFATMKKSSVDKRVVVYCTGGVRCEKFSGWMVREGYKDVGGLHGGIATYGKDPEVQGELRDGKMYVFDERIAVDINHVEPCRCR